MMSCDTCYCDIKPAVSLFSCFFCLTEKISMTVLFVQAQLYLSPQAVGQCDRTRGPPEHTWRSDWIPSSCLSVPPDLHNRAYHHRVNCAGWSCLPASQGYTTLVMWMCLCGYNTFLCELLSFTEETVEDGTEVTQQSLAVLQELQGLRVCEVWWAVKQRCTYKTNIHKATDPHWKKKAWYRQHRNCELHKSNLNCE